MAARTAYKGVSYTRLSRRNAEDGSREWWVVRSSMQGERAPNILPSGAWLRRAKDKFEAQTANITAWPEIAPLLSKNNTKLLMIREESIKKLIDGIPDPGRKQPKPKRPADESGVVCDQFKFSRVCVRVIVYRVVLHVI